MSVVGEFTVPSNQFALGDTLQAVPTVTVEFERVVTHSQEWVMPFLWAYGDDLKRFDDQIHHDRSIKTEKITDEFDGVLLYKIEWNDTIEALVNAIFDRDGVLLEAVGKNDTWTILVRFDHRDHLTALQDNFTDRDATFTLKRLYTPTKPWKPPGNVTADQREALVTAVELGYFEIPRQTTLDEIADALNISRNAVSERLRRGVTNVVRHELMEESSEDQQRFRVHAMESGSSNDTQI